VLICEQERNLVVKLTSTESLYSGMQQVRSMRGIQVARDANGFQRLLWRQADMMRPGL